MMALWDALSCAVEEDKRPKSGHPGTSGLVGATQGCSTGPAGPDVNGGSGGELVPQGSAKGEASYRRDSEPNPPCRQKLRLQHELLNLCTDGPTTARPVGLCRRMTCSESTSGHGEWPLAQERENGTIWPRRSAASSRRRAIEPSPYGNPPSPAARLKRIRPGRGAPERRAKVCGPCGKTATRRTP